MKRVEKQTRHKNPTDKSSSADSPTALRIDSNRAQSLRARRIYVVDGIRWEDGLDRSVDVDGVIYTTALGRWIDGGLSEG